MHLYSKEDRLKGISYGAVYNIQLQPIELVNRNAFSEEFCKLNRMSSER